MGPAYHIIRNGCLQLMLRNNFLCIRRVAWHFMGGKYKDRRYKRTDDKTEMKCVSPAALEPKDINNSPLYRPTRLPLHRLMEHTDLGEGERNGGMERKGGRGRRGRGGGVRAAPNPSFASPYPFFCSPYNVLT